MTERLSGARAFALLNDGAQLEIGRPGAPDRAGRRVDLASLLPPTEIVAVIGASRRRGTVGTELLRAIVDGGFGGAVYAVNPHCTGPDMHGVPCVETLADLPAPPDLAVITVQGYAVPGVAATCGRYGISALLVISPDPLTADQGSRVLTTCNEHGMRLIAPTTTPEHHAPAPPGAPAPSRRP